LHQRRAATGLDREEAHLQKLLTAQGRRSGRGGASFEGLARTLTRSEIVPDLTRGDAGRLRVLQGVTLGAARTELDFLVVRLSLPRPKWGPPAPALSRLSFPAPTDERWDPGRDTYLDPLRRWCQALAGPLETPDVLRLYSATPKRARQILIASFRA